VGDSADDTVNIGDAIPGEGGADEEIPFSERVSGDTPLPPSDIIAKPDKVAARKTQAVSGVPSVAEWQDFIGRIVLRTLLDGYMTLMLRDCDLTPQEEKYLELSKEDLKEMAAPFAGFANKNKVLRKHGRSIISAADSWEAIVSLSIWMRRVHRVSRRHRPEIAAQAAARKAEKAGRQHTHAAQQTARQNNTVIPRAAAEMPAEMMAERSQANGTNGQAESDGRPTRPATWRPPPPDFTVNPGSG
jgi:hypothetical protein